MTGARWGRERRGRPWYLPRRSGARLASGHLQCVAIGSGRASAYRGAEPAPTDGAGSYRRELWPSRSPTGGSETRSYRGRATAGRPLLGGTFQYRLLTSQRDRVTPDAAPGGAPSSGKACGPLALATPVY